MNREEAINAGARAAALWIEEDWDEMEGEDREDARECVAAILDAALPHLVGEPVGYVALDGADVVASYSTHGLEDALDEAREAGGYVAALIPVVEP